jgi:hypothetical protein
MGDNVILRAGPRRPAAGAVPGGGGVPGPGAGLDAVHGAHGAGAKALSSQGGACFVDGGSEGRTATELIGWLF